MFKRSNGRELLLLQKETNPKENASIFISNFHEYENCYNFQMSILELHMIVL